MRLFRNDLAILIKRLLIVYVLLFLCRILFYAMNTDSLGAIVFAEIPGLVRGSFIFDTISVLYVNSLFIFLSLIPFRFRAHSLYQRVLKWLFLVVNSIVIILNLADSIYFHYAKKRFTSDEFHFTGNDNNWVLIGKFTAENWYVVIIGILLISGMARAYRKIKYHPFRIRNNYVYYPVNTAILAIAVLLCIGGIRGGFTRAVRPLALGNATQYAPSPQKAAMILSNPFCIIRTLGSSRIEVPAYFTKEELEKIFTPYHYPDESTYDLGKRNVIIFTLESFSSEHSAFLNPELYTEHETNTPFLDSLMASGYVFMDAYANGRKSIDALPSILTSIPSYKKPFALLPQSLGNVKGLPALLSEEGYYTSFFCGSQRNSMGFAAFASLSGIENIYMREDYEKIYGSSDFDGAWGIWDEPFLRYMAETVSGFQQPFMASVFTLTSHHPFQVPDRYKNLLGEGRTKIHKPVRYTELAIRGFFEYAKGEPWYQNSIFVFVADHVSSEIFAEKTKTPTGNSSIIMFIYTPDNAIIDKDRNVAQQMDIMPTLLGLTGYDKPYFAFGRDVFNEPERMPNTTNYINESFQFINDSVVIFSDGSAILSAFEKSDTLQIKDLKNPVDPQQKKAERYLKAILQQYYTHVNEMNYTVPNNQ